MAFWYNCADLFVYPSVFEGFGLPVLEAMACGMPVLTSDASSLPEVVGPAGLCLAPHEPPAWTEALRRSGQDPDWLKEARERGLERARQFSWRETAARKVESYRKAMNNPP